MTQTNLTPEQAREDAIKAIEQYLLSAKRPDTDIDYLISEFFEHSEDNIFSYKERVVSLLAAFAHPEVNKAMVKALSEYQLVDTIKLLTRLADLCDFLNEDYFKAILRLMDLKHEAPANECTHNTFLMVAQEYNEKLQQELLRIGIAKVVPNEVP